jgi:hypothetical protein
MSKSDIRKGIRLVPLRVSAYGITFADANTWPDQTVNLIFYLTEDQTCIEY